MDPINFDGDRSKLYKICGIGAGMLGVPTCSIIASECPDIEVAVVDEDERLIDQWNSGSFPIDEPGLSEVLHVCLGSNLTISSDFVTHLTDADMILICVNTPAKSLGVGRGRAADPSVIEHVARRIAEFAKPSAVIVLQSTVPIATTDHVARILQANDSEASEFVVLSNPQFISDGHVIKNLLIPDHIIIGGNLDSPASLEAMEILKSIYAHWVPDEKIVLVSNRSAEVAKLVTNAFLAQRISSINSLSGLCEETAADVRQVANAVGRDLRIGPHFLQASLGFGGSTLPKDIRHLVYMCEALNLPMVAAYWDSVLDANEYQVSRFFRKVTSHYYETLRSKRIAIFGCTFKEGSPDVIDSPAIIICCRLINERATVAIFDPLASKDVTFEAISEQLGSAAVEENVVWCQSPAEAAKGADGIILCTDSEALRGLNYEDIYNSMRKPASFFDGRLVVDHRRLMDIGFHVEAVGVSLK